MTIRSLARPQVWTVAVLAALTLTTAVSFLRAQSVPANSVTFQPGAAIPVRGPRVDQRPVGYGYSLPGSPPPFFGGFPKPVQIFPSNPRGRTSFPNGGVLPPTFSGANGIAGSGQQTQGALGTGGAQGVSGGAAGISGGGSISGGISGGIGGAAGISGGGSISGGGGISGGALGGGSTGGQQGGTLVALGQNFQNPTGVLGFPQAPVSYIGGFGGGGITGSGIAGINGLSGGIQVSGISGAGGVGGVGGISGAGGGFGGGGIGGKGVGFAGANGS